MTTLLQLNNSLFGDEGKSSQLTDAFVAKWREREPDVRVIRRDLTRDPVPHLSLEAFSAAATPLDQRTQEQSHSAGLADTLIDELMAADALVIGLPVYNFNLPSTLKTWFDHVARAGTTFRYTSSGPEGLVRARRAFVFVASGGQYAGTQADFQAPYIKHFLGFLGIDEVSFIYAEGLAMGDEKGREALAEAHRQIATLAHARSAGA